MESEHQVPIWFFVGFLLLIYGLLIFGAGIYALQVPDGRANQLEGLLAGSPLVLPARRHLVGRGDGGGRGRILLSLPSLAARRDDHRAFPMRRESILATATSIRKHYGRHPKSS